MRVTHGASHRGCLRSAENLFLLHQRYGGRKTWPRLQIFLPVNSPADCGKMTRQRLLEEGKPKCRGPTEVGDAS